MPALPYTLVDLLGIIDPDRKLDYTDYCSSTKYWCWEIRVAIPALKAKGYVIMAINFQTLEGDSCGPLTRGIRVKSPEGLVQMAWYG